MATNNLQTDVFLESPDLTGVLYTDQWASTPVVVIVSATLSTDIWSFETEGISTLPVYNPSLITSIARVHQNLQFPQFVIAGQGGVDEDEFTLSKKSTTQLFTMWRSPVYNIGEEFDVMSVEFNLITDLAAGSRVTPFLYFDNEREVSQGTTITTASYSNDNKLVKLTSKSFSNTVHGKHNFFLELRFEGATLAVVGLPIFIDIETHEN